MMPGPDIAAVIVAAGRGRRAGGGVPKQWREIGGRRIADLTVEAFRAAGIARIVFVVAEEEAHLAPEGAETVPGGATRRESVRAGLARLGSGTSAVLIHDVARPLVTQATIRAVLDALDTHAGAAPALAVTDALWRGDATVAAPVPRDGLWRAQTPQGFRLEAIRAAHDAHAGPAMDDVEVALAHGLDIAIVPGDERNLKITLPGDFARAEALMGEAMKIRTGNGYDVHRFGPGDRVILCGVEIPHDRALAGHSDADVGMHALTDAILGALAEGDIGRHFPPSDPRWKGAASEIFLARAVEIAGARGWRLGNADVTLVCERPKIGPHAAEMAGELARICGVVPGQVSVKATTSERLGFTGREEGIAAFATVTLEGGAEAT